VAAVSFSSFPGAATNRLMIAHPSHHRTIGSPVAFLRWALERHSADRRPYIQNARGTPMFIQNLIDYSCWLIPAIAD
jgi:hypothetical protein